MAYTPTTWVEGTTKVGPTNLNHLETGLQASAVVADAAIPKSTVTTAGDVIYATGNAAVTRLGLGGVGTVLKGGASAPSFSSIVNADIDAAAAIAKSKLASLAIVNADVDAAAAIVLTKLNIPGGTTQFARADGTWAVPAGATTMLRGKITGATGAVTYGTGFSCARNSAGNYTITFTAAFTTNPPVVLFQTTDSTLRLAAVTALSTSAVTVVIETTAGAATDDDFNFLAVQV